MSYCDPAWISDYHFNKALEYRIDGESAAAVLAAGGRAKRLLLWGSVSPDGELSLDPAFVLDAPVKMPSRPGPYRIEGFGAAGNTEFSLEFEMDELSLGGGSFLFMIPFEEARLVSLERVVLSGPERTVELNGETNNPMAIIIDRATGRIRSVLRGEAAAGRAAALAGQAAAQDRGAEVLVSRGLPRRTPN